MSQPISITLYVAYDETGRARAHTDRADALDAMWPAARPVHVAVLHLTLPLPADPTVAVTIPSQAIETIAADAV